MLEVIDFEDDAELVNKWRDTMEKFGFAVIVNHGIDVETMSKMFETVRKFFLEKSDAEKLRFNFGVYGHRKGGFTPMGHESVARSITEDRVLADTVESYVLNRFAVSNTNMHDPELIAAGQKYISDATQLLFKLHRMSALALGVNPSFFDEFHPVENANVILRCSHYPPFPNGIPTDSMRYGPHFDYQGFTILAVDPDEEVDELDVSTGLQVFIDNQWMKVDCPPGALIVNAGDLMSHWTGSKWPSTLHRVTNPSPHSKAAFAHRFSLPFFTGPDDSTMVKPINGKGEAINAREHLMKKLRKSNV